MPDADTHVVDEVLVPSWYGDLIRRRKEEIRRLALARDPAYRDERERALRDTKPGYYADTSDKRRPIIVWSGHGMWYLDAKEKAMRLKEKPNPAQDPDQPYYRRDPKADISDSLDRRRRAGAGTRVFHISGNPLARED